MPLPSTRPGYLPPSTKVGSQEVEIFLDVVCPFSKKAFQQLTTLSNVPNVTVTIIGVAQPWHSQSATLHRALASVHSLKPETSWAFLGALYEASSTWEDAETENLSENQILEKASKIAESATGIEASAVLSNCKSAEVTTLLKDHARYSRGNSVHVTPTVLFNGCRVVDFSSSWTIEDWAQFLQNP